jgi:hypothetical protein
MNFTTLIMIIAVLSFLKFTALVVIAGLMISKARGGYYTRLACKAIKADEERLRKEAKQIQKERR